MTEREQAILIANKLLDRNFADPDDDENILARQFLRAIERVNALEEQLKGLRPHVEHEDGRTVLTRRLA